MGYNVSLFINKYVSKHSDYILSAVLILFFGLEFYSKICEVYFDFYPSQLSQILKGIVFFTFIFLLFFTKDFKVLTILSLLIVSFCIGQFYLENSFSKDSVKAFFRYLFPILLFIFYNSFRKPKKNSLFLKLFETLILLNSILIILGFLFSIKLFETYSFSRFGYNGIIYASASSSYLYLIGLFYFLVKQQKQEVLNLKLILVLISCCLIGTKSIYITLVLLLFYFVFRIKSKFKILILLFLVVFSFFSAYFFIFNSETFSKITAKNGLLSAVLSYRNEIFSKNMLPFIQNEWCLENYFFGGFPNLDLRSEMGFVDLYFMFGTIGFILYLWLYIKLYFTFKLGLLTWFFMFILIFMIFISGNFFLYSITSLFLIAYKENVLYPVVNN